MGNETPTNDAPVTVEQCDRELYALIAPDMCALILDGELDQHRELQAIARHRLAALASAPAGDGVERILTAEKAVGALIEQLYSGGVLKGALNDDGRLRGQARGEAYAWKQIIPVVNRLRAAVAELSAAALARPRAAVGERRWFPHKDFAGEPMEDGQFREPYPMAEEREAIALIAFNAMRAANQLPEVDTIKHAPARAFYLAAAAAILALQSPPAKVEG